MVELSKKLVVFGEHILRARYPTSIAKRSEELHVGGQILQRDHAQGPKGPIGHESDHDPWPVGHIQK